MRKINIFILFLLTVLFSALPASAAVNEEAATGYNKFMIADEDGNVKGSVTVGDGYTIESDTSFYCVIKKGEVPIAALYTYPENTTDAYIQLWKDIVGIPDLVDSRRIQAAFPTTLVTIHSDMDDSTISYAYMDVGEYAVELTPATGKKEEILEILPFISEEGKGQKIQVKDDEIQERDKSLGDEKEEEEEKEVAQESDTEMTGTAETSSESADKKDSTEKKTTQATKKKRNITVRTKPETDNGGGVVTTKKVSKDREVSSASPLTAGRIALIAFSIVGIILMLIVLFLQSPEFKSGREDKRN